MFFFFIIVCKNIYKYYQDIVMLLLILSLPDAFILLQCQSETNNTNDWNRNCGTCCVCDAAVWVKNMQLHSFFWSYLFNNASNTVAIWHNLRKKCQKNPQIQQFHKDTQLDEEKCFIFSHFRCLKCKTCNIHLNIFSFGCISATFSPRLIKWSLKSPLSLPVFQLEVLSFVSDTKTWRKWVL